MANSRNLKGKPFTPNSLHKAQSKQLRGIWPQLKRSWGRRQLTKAAANKAQIDQDI